MKTYFVQIDNVGFKCNDVEAAYELADSLVANNRIIIVEVTESFTISGRCIRNERVICVRH